MMTASLYTRVTTQSPPVALRVVPPLEQPEADDEGELMQRAYRTETGAAHATRWGSSELNGRGERI